MEGENENAVD